MLGPASTRICAINGCAEMLVVGYDPNTRAFGVKKRRTGSCHPNVRRNQESITALLGHSLPCVTGNPNGQMRLIIFVSVFVQMG